MCVPICVQHLVSLFISIWQCGFTKLSSAGNKSSQIFSHRYPFTHSTLNTFLWCIVAVFEQTMCIFEKFPYRRFLDDGSSNIVMAAVLHDQWRTTTLTLVSPTLTVTTPSCLTFRYKADWLSVFRVTLRPALNVSWGLDRHFDFVWRNATLNLPEGNYLLTFIVRAGNAVVYLDDIQVLRGGCPETDDG